MLVWREGSRPQAKALDAAEVAARQVEAHGNVRRNRDVDAERVVELVGDVEGVSCLWVVRPGVANVDMGADATVLARPDGQYSESVRTSADQIIGIAGGQTPVDDSRERRRVYTQEPVLRVYGDIANAGGDVL